MKKHVLAILLILASFRLVHAQEQAVALPTSDETSEERLDRAVWAVEAQARSEYLFGSDLDGSSESIDVWSNRIDFSFRGPVWRGGFLTIDLGYEHRDYDFDGRNTFFAGSNEPWNSVNSVGLRLTLLQALGGKWGALVMVDGRGAAEYGAELTDGLSAFMMAGVGHQCTDNFRAGLGLAMLARFEEDLLVFPGFYLDWQIDESWRFALFGPRAQLDFEPDEDWKFVLSLGLDGRRFRLSDDGPKNNGIAQEIRLPLALETSYRGIEKLTISLRFGVDLLREYRISDRHGDNERSWNAEVGAFVGLSVLYSF